MQATPLALLDKVVLNSTADDPLHSQVNRALRRLIEEEFDDGQLFFKEMDLAQSLKVSRPTIRQALQALELQGLIRRSKGSGTFVLKNEQMPGTLSHVAGFVDSFESEFVNSLSEEIAIICRQRHIHYHACRLSGRKPAECLEFVHPAKKEGILVLSGVTELARYFSKLGYRVVLRDPSVPDEMIASVGTDPTAALRVGLLHLRELGHKRITLLVTEPPEHATVSAKIDEFVQSKRESEQFSVVSGFAPGVHGAFNVGYCAMKQAYCEANRPTAVFAVSDFGAMGAIAWCHDNGVKVPQDVSVLGYEGIKSGQRTSPPLTTVQHSVHDIAQHMVDLLLSGMSEQIRTDPQVLLRRSTAAPSEASTVIAGA